MQISFSVSFVLKWLRISTHTSARARAHTRRTEMQSTSTELHDKCRRKRTVTFGPERSTLWTHNPTYSLLSDLQDWQHTKLVEWVSSQVQNCSHLLRGAGVLDDRARPPDSTLIAAMVVTQLVLHLVVERDGRVHKTRPRRPHDRHLWRRCTWRLQCRWILQTWYRWRQTHNIYFSVYLTDLVLQTYARYSHANHGKPTEQQCTNINQGTSLAAEISPFSIFQDGGRRHLGF